MDSMNDDNYIRVYIWMRKLKLTPSETLVYALIYGFSNSKFGTYVGTYDDIARLLYLSKKTVERSMESLLDKGLVIRKKWQVNGYRITYQYQSSVRQNDVLEIRQNDVSRTRQNDVPCNKNILGLVDKENQGKSNIEKSGKNTFRNFAERQYSDYVDLEKKLIEK